MRERRMNGRFTSKLLHYSLHLLQYLVGVASIEGAIGVDGEMFVVAMDKINVHL